MLMRVFLLLQNPHNCTSSFVDIKSKRASLWRNKRIESEQEGRVTDPADTAPSYPAPMG